MTSPPLYRVAAVAFILSAVLTVTGFVAHPSPDIAGMTGGAWPVSHLLLWVGGITGAVGLVGLYLQQRSDVGRMGLGGVALAVVGLLALTGAYYFEAIIVPTLVVEATALMETFPGGSAWVAYRVAIATSGVALGLGFVMFGLALLRTRLFPAGVVGAASLGALGAGVQFALPRSVSLGAILLLGIGLVGLGVRLWGSAG